MADDVKLTDLEVIQRYSLAVRGATASREELVAALEADLAWLTGRRGRPAAEAPAKTVAKKVPAAAKKAPAAVKAAPAGKRTKPPA